MKLWIDDVRQPPESFVKCYDWVQIDSYEIPITNYCDFDTVRVYKCRCCGKKRER